MVDERYVEPDYFVDRPPDAIYVPPDMGSDKATHMDERNDPDLFDFRAEAEPILQVLVGKAIELRFVEGTENTADVLTKPLVQVTHEKHVAKLLKLCLPPCAAAFANEAPTHAAQNAFAVTLDEADLVPWRAARMRRGAVGLFACRPFATAAEHIRTRVGRGLGSLH